MLEAGMTDITVAEDWELETRDEAGPVGIAGTIELAMLVDSTTTEDPWTIELLAKTELWARADGVALKDATELKTLVDSTTVEDSWATPETVTVTTVGTWTTELLRIVVR